MSFNKILYIFKPVRFKTDLVKAQRDTNVSNFIKNLRRRFIYDTYFELEDDYKRVSRSTKISHYALGMFLLIPTGLALFSPSTPSYINLLSHQFKVSSLALCWLSSNYLAFSICKFGKTSLLASSRGLVGLLFAIMGATGTLIIGDYDIIKGLYTLMGCYALLGGYNYLLTHKKLLPRSVFIPSSALILLNMATLAVSILKSGFVKEDLSTTSYEDIVKRFESSKMFKNSLNKSPTDNE